MKWAFDAEAHWDACVGGDWMPEAPERGCTEHETYSTCSRSTLAFARSVTASLNVQ